MEKISPEEGVRLVGLARTAIEAKLGLGKFEVGEDLPGVFREPRGVFITLKTHDKGELRGCIGFPEPVMPLVDAVVNAAGAAAFKDPRFTPVSKNEMRGLVVELTVLTPPELIDSHDPAEIISQVKIGTHGLIVRYITGRAGLLLPQVPVENHWGVEEFLGYTCMKAGMPRDTWAHPDCSLFRFQGQIFAETEPGGEVQEISL